MLDDHAVQQRADGVETAHVQTCGGRWGGGRRTHTIKAQTRTCFNQKIVRSFTATVQINDPDRAAFRNRAEDYPIKGESGRK